MSLGKLRPREVTHVAKSHQLLEPPLEATLLSQTWFAPELALVTILPGEPTEPLQPSGVAVGIGRSKATVNLMRSAPLPLPAGHPFFGSCLGLGFTCLFAAFLTPPTTPIPIALYGFWKPLVESRFLLHSLWSSVLCGPGKDRLCCARVLSENFMPVIGPGTAFSRLL